MLVAAIAAGCAPASGGPAATPSPSTASATASTTVPSPPPSPAAGVVPSALPVASDGAAATGGSAVLVGAGDIGRCGTAGPETTARLVAGVLAAHPGATVFTAGDNAYPVGSASDFERCYEPTWGAFRDRTRPAAGNHDWLTTDAAGYRGYFGAAAGPGGATWYAYDAGTWRVLVLDSDCGSVGGCDPASPQGRWLAAELADRPAACTLAIWHRPRFSSGAHGSSGAVAPLFAAVAAAGVDLVVNGHDHDYERFARLAPDGTPDPAGTREFVVGTGGAEPYRFGEPLAGSEARVTGVPAVLVLELGVGGYAWTLLGGPDARVLDAGRDGCTR